MARPGCGAARSGFAKRCTADPGPRFSVRQPGSRVCSAPLPPALAALGRGSCCAAPWTRHDNPAASRYTPSMSNKPPLHPALKLTLELGPLVLFFVGNARWGIFAATAVFMVAILIALAASYALTRRLPIMALVSAVIVTVFGGLTLFLHDETFIKIKPTIIYALF